MTVVAQDSMSGCFRAQRRAQVDPIRASGDQDLPLQSSRLIMLIAPSNLGQAPA
jgi:hypothetical protein